MCLRINVTGVGVVAPDQAGIHILGGVIPQRGFGDVTSRTYLSKLETGKSSITLDKLDQLSERLELSPLPLLTLTPSKSTGQPAQ
uniref:helix-turn-helix transcriptional regulator n=1 Tax=Pseudomonas chlororaphis TaxID=587753 RepID=UPI00294FF5AE|nr:helix-turn-helix transcriptional regulator [Pseudomonas chlororaphis]